MAGKKRKLSDDTEVVDLVTNNNCKEGAVNSDFYGECDFLLTDILKKGLLLEDLAETDPPKNQTG